jgi:hypothetical protein
MCMFLVLVFVEFLCVCGGGGGGGALQKILFLYFCFGEGLEEKKLSSCAEF